MINQTTKQSSLTSYDRIPLTKQIMATRRATGKASSDDKNGEANGGSKVSAIQSK